MRMDKRLFLCNGENPECGSERMCKVLVDEESCCHTTNQEYARAEPEGGREFEVLEDGDGNRILWEVETS